MTPMSTYYPEPLMTNVCTSMCRPMLRRIMNVIEPWQWPNWEKENKIFMQPDGEVITREWELDGEIHYRIVSAFKGKNAVYPYDYRSYGSLELKNMILTSPEDGDSSGVDFEAWFHLGTFKPKSWINHYQVHWKRLAEIQDQEICDHRHGEEWEHAIWKKMIGLWPHVTAGHFKGSGLYQHWQDSYSNFNP